MTSIPALWEATLTETYDTARPRWWADAEVSRARLRRHVELIIEAQPSVVVAKGDSDDLADMQHMYRGEVILIRDADLDRVRALVPGEVDDGLINGITAYRVEDGDSEAALTTIEQQLGVGVATPDHVVHVCPGESGLGPATEPEIAEASGPFPEMNGDSATDGSGVLVSVVDTGFLPLLADDAPWLSGVTGDVEDCDPVDIGPYVGHGSFVAGILRTMAPQAQIHVEGLLTHGGTVFESEMIKQLDDALARAPDVICLSAGTHSRRNLGLLGFEVFWESRLRHPKGTVLVAAAGNDHDREPFWPAAFPWAVSVGALDRHDKRAPYTNFGSCVDVYAPGTEIINAFPTGTYSYREPPNVGQVAQFQNGLARWSGTSFATPIVAGLIAARMARTAERGRQAADALLEVARQHAIPGAGAILKPGMAGSAGRPVP
jgi:subtilisin family serine protease